jgi:hypothetical protein
MGEARMAQHMGIQERFRSPAITIEAGRSIVPCAGSRETMPVTLAPFKDHGRPAFIASTIRSRSTLQEAAGNLTEADSQRLNEALSRTMEGFLDEGTVKSDAILKSSREGKPDMHMLIIGNPFQDNSLRLYYHVGEYEGNRVIFQDARTTKKGADKVERTFRTYGGYQTPRNWESKSTGRGGR